MRAERWYQSRLAHNWLGPVTHVSRISPIGSQWGGGWGYRPRVVPAQGPSRQAPFLYSPSWKSGLPAGVSPGRRRSSRWPPASRASSASSARSSPPTTSARPARSTRSRSPSRCRTSSARSSRMPPSRPRSSRSSASSSRRVRRKRAWRVASTLFWLLLLGLGAIDGAPDRRRAADHRPVRRSRRRQAARDHALPDPLPDRRPARRLRDHRRDPQQLRALHGAGADARLLEPRDHRGPRARRSRMPRRSTRSSTSTRSRS